LSQTATFNRSEDRRVMMETSGGGKSMSVDPEAGDDMPLGMAIDDNPDLRLRMGRYLGGIRKLRKISQEQVARDIGMSRPHLSNIEMGRSRTGWKGLREMAAYYSLGIKQLIEDVEREMPSLSTSPSITPEELRQHGGEEKATLLSLRHDQSRPSKRPTKPASGASEGSSFAQDMPQFLQDDERFVIDMFRALDCDARREIYRLIKRLVQQRFDKIGDQ
jgi:transcriptional regulator with XRE-family HTH domain